MTQRTLMSMCVALALAAPANAGQGATVAASDADAFIGTWTISMSVPQGALETVRIWDDGGSVAASVQAEQFPPLEVSDIARMGKYLILSVGRFENGQPIQAIILLSREGENIAMIQELEGSTVTKRGLGRKQ